jgi:hypothetical protein
MMNELIDSFRLYAGIARVHNSAQLVVINEHGNIIDPLIGLEKFALLIVEECKKAIDPTDDLCSMMEEVNRYNCILMIDKHFGVE